MREHLHSAYILASRKYGTLYTGVTGDLISRVTQHREGAIAGFTQKYAVKMLVWYEHFGDVDLAILRETRIKRWNRAWKINLIESDNPHWCDLYPQLLAPVRNIKPIVTDPTILKL